jgi:hypothetical protein
MDDTALTIYNFAPATSVVLAGALVNLREQIEAAARSNLDTVLAQGEEYTETEQMAMLRVEQLRQVNGLDLAAVLLRAEYLREIQNNNLITRHPAGYASLGEMARDQGISLAELSQTLDLANVVFPYVENTLHVPIPVLWEQIGKSNMRELVPVLKAIITGEDAGAASVNQATERIIDDLVATMRSAGQIDDGEDVEERMPEIRQAAVTQLLQDGAHLTNRELRQRIRPERTPSVEVTTITPAGQENVVIVAQMTPEQWELFMRRMGQYADPQPFWAPVDPGQRQREALRIAPLRTLMDFING